MGKHGFRFGDTVQSTTMPSWGPGKVIRVTGDTLLVVFRDYGTVPVKAVSIEAAEEPADGFAWPVVDPDEFRKQVERLRRGTFETRIDGKPFSMRVLPSGIEFTPSSGGARSVTWSHVEEVVAQYNTAGSLSPRDYTNLSRNASYILTLVDRLFPRAAAAGSAAET